MFERKNKDKLACGLHIGGQSIRLAMIRTDAQGNRSLTLDVEDFSIGASYLESMGDALRELTVRNGLDRYPVAVILDGDYCVTRVSTGTPKEVDQDQKRLATRVPRYLSLGPGEKITGGYRESISNTYDYAVTGVANQRVIESLQVCLRNCGLWATSIEPSMVAVARNMQASMQSNCPVLLADGSGTQWDVGIVQDGRLLLDYRPSAARESDRFGQTLCGHMSRLHRFCQRHRHLGDNRLSEVFIHGPSEKAEATARVIESLSEIQARILTADLLIDNCELPEDAKSSCWVGAVAAALTSECSESLVLSADLLESIRTVRQKPLAYHVLWTVIPMVSAAALLFTLFGLVWQTRGKEQDIIAETVRLQDELGELQLVIEENRTNKDKLKVFRSLETKIHRREYANLLVDRIPKCLPNATKLKRIQLSVDGTIRISGTALNESIIFDVTAGLRKLPGVSDVQLEGTSPSGDMGETEIDFSLIIRMIDSQAAKTV